MNGGECAEHMSTKLTGTYWVRCVWWAFLWITGLRFKGISALIILWGYKGWVRTNEFSWIVNSLTCCLSYNISDVTRVGLLNWSNATELNKLNHYTPYTQVCFILHWLVLIFDGYLDSVAAEVPDKFRSDWKVWIRISQLTGSFGKTSFHIVYRDPGVVATAILHTANGAGRMRPCRSAPWMLYVIAVPTVTAQTAKEVKFIRATINVCIKAWETCILDVMYHSA